jgi:hypothetical protein
MKCSFELKEFFVVHPLNFLSLGPLATLKGLLLIGLLGGMPVASWGCRSPAAQFALASPHVATKFSLASQFCEEGAAVSQESVAAVVPEQQGFVARDAREHAQQLSMYGTTRPTPAASGLIPNSSGLPGFSSPSLLRPAQQQGATGGISPLKNMSRESAARAVALVPEINRVAAAYQIDPLLLHAIAHVESRHNPDAVSHAGAMGLMQVMPATARRFGVTSPHSELRDPRISLEVCSAYLKNLQKRFDNNLTLIIAAYNAGEGAVEKYGRQVPPYKETQGYVRDVMAHYLLLVSMRDAGAGTAKPVRATL